MISAGINIITDTEAINQYQRVLSRELIDE
nr:MAG TPA: hypothetical protein [Caudoviricetes sp.]